MQECRHASYMHLQRICDSHFPLLLIWEVSYIDGRVLVLPASAAKEIAEARPNGYHHGVWHLATEYEAFCARAWIINSPSHSVRGRDVMM